jgi:hypothetical protein
MTTRCKALLQTPPDHFQSKPLGQSKVAAVLIENFSLPLVVCRKKAISDAARGYADRVS